MVLKSKVITAVAAAAAGLLSATAHADLVYSSSGTTTSSGTGVALSSTNFSHYTYPSTVPTGVTVYNDDLTATLGGSVTYTYLGAEAGYQNKFATTTPTTLFTTPGTAGTFVACTTACTSSSFTVTAGKLPFEFITGAPTPVTVSNVPALGSAGGNGPSEPDYYVYLQSPDVAYLYLNDAGAGSDRDYNDMIIRVNFTPVPEPSTYALLFSGLAMFGWLARRRVR